MHQESSKQRILRGLFLCGLLAVIAQYQTCAQILSQGLSFIAYPFIITASSLSETTRSFIHYWRSYDELLVSYQKLLSRHEKLVEQYSQDRALARYNDATQELRDFKERYALSGATIGTILAKTLTEQEQSMLVHAGSRHGIKKDMIALYKLQIVGRVIEVYDYYSKILLITDARSKIAACSNTTQAKGLIEGTNSSNEYRFSFVSHLSTIIPDDFILSTGEGLVFPEGFCLGQIKNFSKNNNDLFYSIAISPLIDFSTLKHVLVTESIKISLA